MLMEPDLERGVSDVVCHTGTRKRAKIAAQVVANAEQCPVYVLQGFRPNRRRFWSFAYYVSRREAPRIDVDGLPEEYSVPRLVRTVLPSGGS